MRLLGFFLTWWGAAVLAALDSSMLFFLPFGIDTVVIYLAARDETLFWIYPILAATGSVIGAAISAARLVRFGAEAGLARLYGRGIVQVFESDGFRTVITGFIWIAVAGTIISAVMLWKNTQRQRLRPA